MSRTDERHSSVNQVDAAVLFTDIEGSTSRWDNDAVAMRVQLARHDDVVTKSILDHGGHVVKHTGDGFLARFENGRDATAAAVTAQLRLAQMDFSAVGGLKIRAAVDVGVVENRNGDLYGPAMNRCARLMDAAHGGQVLASEFAWEDLHLGSRCGWATATNPLASPTSDCIDSRDSLGPSGSFRCCTPSYNRLSPRLDR